MILKVINLYIFIYLLIKRLEIIYSDIHTNTSSGIDFAIASTPTGQCISDQTSTTAGNIHFIY